MCRPTLTFSDEDTSILPYSLLDLIDTLMTLITQFFNNISSDSSQAEQNRSLLDRITSIVTFFDTLLSQPFVVALLQIACKECPGMQIVYKKACFL